MNDANLKRPKSTATDAEGVVADIADQNDANVKKPKSTTTIAEGIVAGAADQDVAQYIHALEDPSNSVATKAARVVEEVLSKKPDLGVVHVEQLVKLLISDKPRVVQACAAVLPLIAQVAPAKVARHLGTLTSAFETASDTGKEGMVRIFVALCLASIAYQKRLSAVLEVALLGADGKTLQRWTELLLPALKGEPHAYARSVVERRLNDIPRPIAKKIASFLGIKLRPASLIP
jgi:hypothetical protein